VGDTFASQYVQAAVAVGLGWCIFLSSQSLPPGTLEPLLACLLAGCMLCNRTPHRERLTRVLEAPAGVIYVLFFTYTGASLALDVFIAHIHVAATLFALRISGLVFATLVAGAWAGLPPAHTRASWMAYVTQAGVGVGLSKAVAADPSLAPWNKEFATTMISVIVLNQLCGPPLMRRAVLKVGEARGGAAQVGVGGGGVAVGVPRGDGGLCGWCSRCRNQYRLPRLQLGSAAMVAFALLLLINARLWDG
jgi:Kef-type K+ transport system membrane component KefB